MRRRATRLTSSHTTTSTTNTSKPGHLVCPACESGELKPLRLLGLAGCDSCGSIFDDGDLRTLEQIVALPEALGKHACECGHPEMRRLPDGVFHCPTCGSEVLPIEATSGDTLPREEIMKGRYRR
jgi:ribosomal protein L37AE/L43A